MGNLLIRKTVLETNPIDGYMRICSLFIHTYVSTVVFRLYVYSVQIKNTIEYFNGLEITVGPYLRSVWTLDHISA